MQRGLDWRSQIVLIVIVRCLSGLLRRSPRRCQFNQYLARRPCALWLGSTSCQPVVAGSPAGNTFGITVCLESSVLSGNLPRHAGRRLAPRRSFAASAYRAPGLGGGLGRGLGVAWDLGVGVGLGVGVELTLAVAVGVEVGLDVTVAVAVGVGVDVGLEVAVAVDVGVAVAVAVTVAVAVAVAVAVEVAVAVAVGVGVGVPPAGTRKA
jgi:hypothetical protein